MRRLATKEGRPVLFANGRILVDCDVHLALTFSAFAHGEECGTIRDG